MKYLAIKAKRDAHSAHQCQNQETMTVGEFIEELRNYNKDLPVFILSDNGYTFGNVLEWDMRERFEADETEGEEDEEDE